MRIFQTNSLAATKQMLNEFGIEYDSTLLKNELLAHPDYPSLFAVHQILGKYGLENMPIKADSSLLPSIPVPFLAYMHITGNGSDFAIVNSVFEKTVTYTNGNGKKEDISQEEFEARWKNIAVTIDDTKPRTKKKPETIFLKWQVVLTLSLLFVFLTVTTIKTPSPILFAPWILLKIFGLATTVLLLIYELDKSNKTVKQFCNTGAKINCDAVLQSSGAKIGPFSWSEIGFAYFSSTFVYLILAGNSLGGYLPLVVLSLLAIPYTFYSIFYQYKVVKQWCRLCLTIQCIIILEAVFAVVFLATRSSIELSSVDWQTALLLIVILPLPLILWLAIKQFLQNGMQFDDYRFAYLRLINSPDVFNMMLLKQKPAPVGHERASLLIGNPNAKNEIIKVCNPFCKPCAKAHPILEEIVAENPDVNMRIMFANPGNKKDKKQKVAKHFVNLYHTKGQTAAQEAMHYWYTGNNKDVDTLISLYPTDEFLESDDILLAMDNWQTEAEITRTPTIFVNGYVLPRDYTTENLKEILWNSSHGVEN